MKDFKKGDRVCIKDKSHVESSPLLNYAYLMVIDINDDNVTLGMPGSNLHLIVETDSLELYKSPDPKTAFLTELQALMKRYNATIDVDGDECALWLTIDIDGHAIEYVAYDFYTGKEKQTALTPDNIFDYDKE